jgi:hypothetical protein
MLQVGNSTKEIVEVMGSADTIVPADFGGNSVDFNR